MASRPGPSYKISVSERELQKLENWLAWAKEVGIRDTYLSVLEALEEKLRSQPLQWGDPQYRLHGLGLLMMRGIEDFLQVNYGVDETRRIVYVSEFKLLPWNPLE